MGNPFVSGRQLAILLTLSGSRGKYALEIARAAGLKRGTIYVTLDRLADRGMVKYTRPRQWEHAGMSRPIYTLTSQGAAMVKAFKQLATHPTGEKHG